MRIIILNFIFFITLNVCGQECIKATKIWDRAPNNAFTSLLFHEGYFYCSFREAKKHIDRSGDDNGIIRVIRSKNAQKWEDFGEIKRNGVDLRDPKLSVTPDGRIMVLMGGSFHNKGKTVKYCSHVSFISEENHVISEPVPIKVNFDIPNLWLWKITWYDGVAYGFNYTNSFNLLKSVDGINYELVKTFNLEGHPTESSICFEKDKMIALIRCDSANGFTGSSLFDYTDWNFVDCGYRISGMDLELLPNGDKIIASKIINNNPQTAIFKWNKDGKIEPIFTLPSGGDCGYPGMVVVGNNLYISYYSSHEGCVAIYISVLPLNELVNGCK